MTMIIKPESLPIIMNDGKKTDGSFSLSLMGACKALGFCKTEPVKEMLRYCGALEANQGDYRKALAAVTVYYKNPKKHYIFFSLICNAARVKNG